MITEKPNNILKDQLDLNLRSKLIPKHISDKIEYHFKVPNAKYDHPLTSSQELGWDSSDMLNRSPRRGRIGCDVSRYADEYYALKGRSPYASRNPINFTKEAKK